MYNSFTRIISFFYAVICAHVVFGDRTFRVALNKKFGTAKPSKFFSKFFRGSQPAIDFGDSGYLMQLQIGTPPQVYDRFELSNH